MGDLKREKEILNILITDIIPNRFQPRLFFDDESMRELANSISEHGIIQPLVVRRVTDKYEIIAGERRYKAATMAGLQSVPVIVVELNDGESAEVALIENIQRKDLSAIEEAKSYQKVLEMGQLTQEALAKRMGKSQSAVANKIRLLSLPFPIQEALNNNEISERHARSLLSLRTPEEQINMLNRIITERLTVRKTDQAISDALGQLTQPGFDAEVEKLDFLESEPSVPAAQEPQFLDPEPIQSYAPMEPQPPVSNYMPPEMQVPTPSFADSSYNNANPIIPDLPTFSPSYETNSSLIPELPSDQQLDNIGAAAINNDIMLRTDYGAPEPSFDTNDSLLQAPLMSNNPQPLINQSYQSEINEIRDLVKKFNNSGVTADVEEFDFEQFYQLNIKINKNQT